MKAENFTDIDIATLWDVVEKHYPEYSGSNEISYSETLHIIATNEPEPCESTLTELQNDFNYFNFQQFTELKSREHDYEILTVTLLELNAKFEELQHKINLIADASKL